MATKQEQVQQAERLQKLLLDDYERLLTSGTMTAADRNALRTLLSDNGWSIDPADVPQGIRDYLTKTVDPKKFDDDDADVPRVN